MILKIDINKFIVHNKDGLLVIMEVYPNGNKSKDDNTVDFRLYSNPKNLPEDCIKSSLKKTLSLKEQAIMKTRFLASLKKNPFYNPFVEDIIVGEERISPVYMDDNPLSAKISEITNMITGFLNEGEIIPDSHYSINGFIVEGCTCNEISNFLNGFDLLQKNNKNTVSKKNR